MLITGVDLTELIYLLIRLYTGGDAAYVSEDTRPLRFAQLAHSSGRNPVLSSQHI